VDSDLEVEAEKNTSSGVPELFLVLPTYLLQLAGLALLFVTPRLGEGQAMIPALLGGSLALVLGYTIRRQGGGIVAISGALAAVAALSAWQGLDKGALCLCLVSLPLACIYHGELIGEQLMTIAPYSGNRTAPVSGGCVRGVGYVLLLGAIAATIWG